MNAEVRQLKLRPCPFCGEAKLLEHMDSPAELRNGKEPRLTTRAHWWYCSKCKASGPVADSMGEAAIAWNGKEERR